MTELDVAIAIVTYESADLTINCLRSIDEQRTASHLRIIAVVVDNSGLDAASIENAIGKFGWSSWVRVLVAPVNGGFAYGNNLAIEEARRLGPPRFIHFLNPDTVVRARAIDALAEFLTVHSGVGIAGGRFENLDGSDWPIAFRFPTILSELETRLQFGLATRILKHWVVAQRMTPVTQPIDWVSGASMMVRWEVIERVGGFDENYFLYFEETDLCYRARQEGFATWYVPQSRVMHIAGQITKVNEGNTRSRRLPAYWFESRRRFFFATYGLPYAMLTDLVALIAIGLNWLKRAFQRRRNSEISNLPSDLLRHSVLWPRNRRVAAIKDGKPAAHRSRLGNARN